jgi:hypothetical protein
MEFLRTIVSGLVDIGLFMAFGLPALMMIVIFFLGNFSKGGLFSFEGRLGRKNYIIRLICS